MEFNSQQPIETPAQKGPIERQMKAILESCKKSSYQDTFDWTVYDRIAKKFGEQPPRGGVVFNTTLKLVNFHSTCTKCHYSLELDTYGRGCIHDCTYCYAKDLLTAHKFWNEPHPFPVNLAEIRKIFYTVFETDRKSKWCEVLQKRVPIRIGSMSDSFMWMDKRYGVTLELLKILNHYKHPHIIFTRSDLVADDSYLKELDPNLTAVQFSVSADSDEITKLIEPGAPSLSRRLAALKKLHSAGIWTTARLNPLFPTYPDGHFTFEKETKSRLGEDANLKLRIFDIDTVDTFMSKLRESNVPSLLSGFVRLSPVAIKGLSQSLGVDLKKFYRPEFYRIQGDKRYSDAEIAYYYKRLQVSAHKAGIRFNTCYIGNGIKDYFQYQSLWDNRSDCCDVKTNVASFSVSAQEVPWEIREKHAPCKISAKSARQSDEEFTRKYQEEANRPGLKVVWSNPELDVTASKQ